MSVIKDYYGSNGAKVVLEQNDVKVDSNAADDEKPKVR